MKMLVKMLMFALCTSGVIQAKDVRETYSYILKLRLANKSKLQEPIFAFYKGKPLELGTNCAIISESSKVPAFSVIITPDLTHEAEGTNVRYLRRKEDVPFAWYDLTMRSYLSSEEQDEKVALWDVKKLSDEDAPLQIPDHAIVIYFNPELIEKIDSATNTDTCKVVAGSQVIALPTIVMRSDVSDDEINFACVEALLASLELRSIHKKASVTTKCDQRTIMSLCKTL
jgi:hypothetical protein